MFSKLEYLHKLVMEDETAYEDAMDYKDEWVRQLIEHLNNKISQATTTVPTIE